MLGQCYMCMSRFLSPERSLFRHIRPAEWHKMGQDPIEGRRAPCDAVQWKESSDQPVQLAFKLRFVDGFDDKVGVLQRRANGPRGETYLRLNVFTCMLTKT